MSVVGTLLLKEGDRLSDEKEGSLKSSNSYLDWKIEGLTNNNQFPNCNINGNIL